MSGVVLRSVKDDVRLRLPWWPSDVSRTLQGWTTSDLDRPGREPLSVPSSLTTEELSMGFTLRREDYRASIADLVGNLEQIALLKRPFQILMGDQLLGLFRADPPSLTYLAWADDGSPSVVDVQLVCKRASTATINVGPVKIRGGGKGFAT